jgi:hypothetical protein
MWVLAAKSVALKNDSTAAAASAATCAVAAGTTSDVFS